MNRYERWEVARQGLDGFLITDEVKYLRKKRQVEREFSIDEVPHCIERGLSLLEQAPNNWKSLEFEFILARMFFLYGITEATLTTQEGNTMTLGLTGCYTCTCYNERCEPGACCHFALVVRSLVDSEGKPVIEGIDIEGSATNFEIQSLRMGVEGSYEKEMLPF